MSRNLAIQTARRYFEDGRFRTDLGRRISLKTVSQEDPTGTQLYSYLDTELRSSLEELGFACDVYENPRADSPPFLVARRVEDASFRTILMYGHGDVVRGQDTQWKCGSPWTITVDGDRWYGRGTADNKGQHSINIGALMATLDARTQLGQGLGFNVTLLIEMGEEVGSPGLAEFCDAYAEQLTADLFLASDGPRLSAERPTIFLGSRGTINFELSVSARERPYHSGNWGGLLSNPGIRLANALSSMIDGRGRIAIDALRAVPITSEIADAISGLVVGADAGDPTIEEFWGESQYTPAERVFGTNTMEILAMTAGDPLNPVGAIPPSARAFCQLRFVVGTDWTNLKSHVRDHLDRCGFEDVELCVTMEAPATRLSPNDPWVEWAVASLAETTGLSIAILPNLGGSIPNHPFAEILGQPTIWIPHSYPGCAQHAPDEHLLGSVARQSLEMMSALFWDFGEELPSSLSAAHKNSGAQ